MEMGNPTYSDLAADIVTRLDRMERRLKEMSRMVTSIYHDEEPEEMNSHHHHAGVHADVTGPDSGYEKIPYYLLEKQYSDEIKKFREFLHHVKTTPDIFNDFERESADIADKRFADVRISKKSATILFGIYKKAFGQPWKFPFKNTYLYINRETNDRVWSDEL